MTATEQKLKIQPLSDRVVIELLEEETQTSGGIFIPDSAREKPMKGKVIAVGAGRTLDNGTKEAMTVKENDIVLFTKYGGTELKMGGTEYKILSEKDILGIVAS